MNKNIILLTATIKPKKQPNLKIVDANERLQEYKIALKFYIDKLYKGIIDGIVFVDNSGYDLDQLDVQSTDNIELISYWGLDYPQEYHRGYGEFELINYAHNHSRILKNLQNQDHVHKISGRYIIKNIRLFLFFAPKHYDLYINTIEKKAWASMEIVSWSQLGYQHIVKNFSALFAKNYPPELTLYTTLKTMNKQEVFAIIDKHYYPIYIVGRRGTDKSKYRSKFHLIKSLYCLLKLPMYKYKNPKNLST